MLWKITPVTCENDDVGKHDHAATYPVTCLGHVRVLYILNNIYSMPTCGNNLNIYSITGTLLANTKYELADPYNATIKLRVKLCHQFV